MPLTQGALQGVLSSATEKVFLQCLVISHPDITDLYLVNDTKDLVRSEATFQRFPFSVSAASQDQGKPPSIDISADAVDQRVLKAMRRLAGKREKAKIRYEIVLANTPDSVEFGPITFEFDTVAGGSSTQVQIRATILKGALDDAFPKDQFAPSNVS